MQPGAGKGQFSNSLASTKISVAHRKASTAFVALPPGTIAPQVASVRTTLPSHITPHVTASRSVAPDTVTARVLGSIRADGEEGGLLMTSDATCVHRLGCNPRRRMS